MFSEVLSPSGLVPAHHWGSVFGDFIVLCNFTPFAWPGRWLRGVFLLLCVKWSVWMKPVVCVHEHVSCVIFRAWPSLWRNVCSWGSTACCLPASSVRTCSSSASSATTTWRRTTWTGNELTHCRTHDLKISYVSMLEVFYIVSEGQTLIVTVPVSLPVFAKSLLNLLPDGLWW